MRADPYGTNKTFILYELAIYQNRIWLSLFLYYHILLSISARRKVYSAMTSQIDHGILRIMEYFPYCFISWCLFIQIRWETDILLLARYKNLLLYC